MPTKLTTAAVNRLKPHSGNYIEYDADTKGFGIRVTPSGAKSFILTYRLRSGWQRRYTIGRYPDWSCLSCCRERIPPYESPAVDCDATATVA